MTDIEAVVRAYLATVAGITALTGARIYAGVDLPAGYTPSAGSALIFSIRGGGQDFSSHVLAPSMQFRAYGATEAAARALDQALYAGLNDVKAGSINWARCEVLGQIVREPETGWAYVISFYRVLMTNP